jgi:phosphatidylethanolamine-binding protein (PEBP) family uncharacterized protein
MKQHTPARGIALWCAALAGAVQAGAHRSPTRPWAASPAGARRFATTPYDRNAPPGPGWWHGVIDDISALVRMPSEDASHADGRGPAGRGRLRCPREPARVGHDRIARRPLTPRWGPAACRAA